MPEEFVPTPHDHLVKHIFGLPEVTAGLFEAYLDPVLLEGVDLSALRQKPGSFVDPELRASHTDLLFTAPWGNGETLFHLLLEHSTKVERFAALNLARYQVEILRDHLRSRQPEAPGLPPVISVVLHQGGPWTAPRRLSELVEGIEEGTARGEDSVPKVLQMLGPWYLRGIHTTEKYHDPNQEQTQP